MLNDILTMLVLPVEFSCTILNDNLLISNVYYLKVGIDPNMDNLDNVGIGFQRIQHLVDHYLQNSIFINQEHPLAKDLSGLSNNLVCLPCEAYDVYVGSILFAKFEAITEKYFDIQYISVASMVGDHVQYNILSPYDSNLDLEGDYWWNMDNVNTGSKDVITWDELNLTEVPKFKPMVIKGGLSEH